MGIAEMAGFNDRVERIEFLEKFVRPNGLAGSELVKAFALFDSVQHTDDESEDYLALLWNAAVEAHREWVKLSAKEKTHILNGWFDPAELQTVAEYAKEVPDYLDNYVAWVLTADLSYDGKVTFFAQPELVTSTAKVQVRFRQGTRKAEALRQLAAIAAAVETHWDEAIATDGKNGVYVEIEQAKFSVGDLVLDEGNEKAGIIIGGFSGAEGSTVYALVAADGTVDMQYGGALKMTLRNRGGLPVVADLNGGDPLANLRVGVRA